MSGDGHTYGETNVTGFAKAILGNVHYHYYGTREPQTEEGWKLLITSFCYEFMNDRKYQIRSASDDTCSWIWKTIFARWLRVKNAKVFWISGKPGSGKSTLMKYLSRSPLVKQSLSNETCDWIVMDFFFDYRLGDKTGNTIEGLLRSLLIQIITRFPSISEELGHDARLDSGNSVEYLEGKLQMAVNAVPHRFLILIDGLDEFSAGKLTYLAEFLLRLKYLRRVKVCLASRPEAPIQSVFEGVPKIAMSEHNLAGIDQYINDIIDKCPTRLNLLAHPDIKELILLQSDGVFLWVHLILDEIVQACAEGAMLVELKERISMLPTELESLYERILDRVPQCRQAEAATIFTLVDTATTHITLSLLRHTMYFLAHEMSLSSLPFNSTKAEHFEQRIHGTMRGLVDIVQGTDERYPDAPPKSPNVRLIHRTLRSYAERTTWFREHLPTPLLQLGPSWIWTHLCSKTILEAERNIVDLTQFKLFSYEHMQDYSSFAQHIVRLSSNRATRHWLALLFHSVLYMPIHAERAVQDGSRALQAFTGTALRSSINHVHYALCGWHSKSALRPISEFLNCEIADLVLAAAHDAAQYLMHHNNRIMMLSDDQRRELVSVVILISSRRQHCPGQYTSISLGTLRDIVDSILRCDERLSSFHLGVYLFLGYSKVPQFLSQSLQQDEYSHLETPIVPSWFVTEPLFAKEPPLFIWACEYETPRGLTAKAQLKSLASFDFDINCKSSAGYNIVHYIITRHIIGHTFLEEKNDYQCCPSDGDDIADAVIKLYLVEEAGADFTMQYQHRTPLQAFRYGVDLIRQATYLAQEVPEARFKHFDFMLQHKEETGHLPQPMLGESHWHKHQIPLLLERRCDTCEAIHAETTTQLVGLDHAAPTRSSMRPERPSPSRIPRPKRANAHSKTIGSLGSVQSRVLTRVTPSSSQSSRCHE